MRILIISVALLFFALVSNAQSFNMLNQENNAGNVGQSRYNQILSATKHLQAKTHQLDSSITDTNVNGAWLPLYKREYKYRLNGQSDSLKEFLLEMNVWRPTVSNTYSYDANDRLIQQVVFEWNKASKTLQPAIKEDFVLNSNGSVLTYTIAIWDTSSMSWLNSFREGRLYSNPRQTIDSTWDIAKSKWIPANRYTRSSKRFGLPDRDTHEKWESTTSSWVPYSRKVHDTPSPGFNYGFTFSIWNTAGSFWENHEKRIFSYNNGGLSRTQDFCWDTSMSIWRPKSDQRRIVMRFGGQSLPVVITDSVYDLANSKWKRTKKQENTFNSSGSQLGETNSMWDSTTSTWSLKDRLVFNFNSHVSFQNIQLPNGNLSAIYWSPFAALNMHMPTTDLKEEFSSNSWNDHLRRNYFYSSPSTTIESLKTLRLKAYPNPSINNISIWNGENTALNSSLYNSLGQQVWHGIVPTGQSSLDVIPGPGIYHLDVESPNGRVTSLKLIRLNN